MVQQFLRWLIKILYGKPTVKAAKARTKTLPKGTINTNNIIEPNYELIVYNNPTMLEDDAIKGVASICGHAMLTAIQLTTLISGIGKASVKVSTDIDKLIQMQEDFNSIGLGATVTIQEPKQSKTE